MLEDWVQVACSAEQLTEKVRLYYHAQCCGATVTKDARLSGFITRAWGWQRT